MFVAAQGTTMFRIPAIVTEYTKLGQRFVRHAHLYTTHHSTNDSQAQRGISAKEVAIARLFRGFIHGDNAILTPLHCMLHRCGEFASQS